MTAKNNRNDNPAAKKQHDTRSGGAGALSTGAAHGTASDSGMKLIPWSDIWTSLRIARMRGNGEMIDVFYDTLFKEATFDDKGAWSPQLRR